MSIQGFDHAEVTRLAQEIASYASMAQAHKQGGSPDHLRGADAASRSAFFRIAEEFGYEVQEIQP